MSSRRIEQLELHRSFFEGVAGSQARDGGRQVTSGAGVSVAQIAFDLRAYGVGAEHLAEACTQLMLPTLMSPLLRSTSTAMPTATSASWCRPRIRSSCGGAFGSPQLVVALREIM